MGISGAVVNLIFRGIPTSLKSITTVWACQCLLTECSSSVCQDLGLFGSSFCTDLLSPHCSVAAALCKKLFMSSGFGDAALVEDNNLISSSDSREAMTMVD
jgi:hypothetical protein